MGIMIMSIKKNIMITVIAEKPSVAKEIATYLKYHSKHNGYFEADNYFITYAYGHLVGLALPEKYGYGFNKESLPMIPQAFKLAVVQEVNKDGKKEVSKSAQSQLNVIKSLFDKSTSIVVATDAGREGELIFRNIYDLLGCKLPFQRLWISSLTAKAIASGFAQLKPGTDYDSLYWSARARAEADWLLGMNATTATTLAAGKKQVISLGRVQTPTLSLIISRYLQFKSFKPEPYSLLQGTFISEGITFKATSSQITDKSIVDKFLLFKGTDFIASQVERKTTQENPPLLHDLSSLQQLANKTFGFSADQTLKLVQELYEAKYITYPRTGSCYISVDVFEEIPELLTKLAHANLTNPISDYIKTNLLDSKLNEVAVNDARVTDHHAIIITDLFPNLDKLAVDQCKIYLLILKRFLESFSKVVIKDRTKLVLTKEQLELKANGFIVLSPGWTKLKTIFAEQADDPQDQEEEDLNMSLPTLVQGNTYRNESIVSLSKMTKPKPLHTEATLLKAMEIAGDEEENEEVRQSMKDKGIGTPATRASIIETLFSRKYISRQKKNLIPTDFGVYLYGKIKDLSLSEVKLTGLWEHKLLEIENNTLSKSIFDKNIKRFTEVTTAELLGLDFSDMPVDKSESKKIICPKCKSNDLVINDKRVFCKGYFDKSCNFGCFREMFGYKLSEAQTKMLMEKRTTETIKKFKSKKTGKLFSAKVVLMNDFTTKLIFDNKIS